MLRFQVPVLYFYVFCQLKKSNSFQNRGPSHPKIIIFNTWWVILALSSCLNAFSQRQHLHTLCVLPGSSFSGSTADVLTPTASAFSLNFSRCTAVQLVISGDCWRLLAEIIINLSTQQCQVTANVFYSGQSDINNSCQHLSKQENAQWDPLGVTSCELEMRLDSVHSGYSCGKHIMVHPRLYPVFRPTVVLKQKPSSPVPYSNWTFWIFFLPASSTCCSMPCSRY